MTASPRTPSHKSRKTSTSCPSRVCPFHPPFVFPSLTVLTIGPLSHHQRLKMHFSLTSVILASSPQGLKYSPSCAMPRARLCLSNPRTASLIPPMHLSEFSLLVGSPRWARLKLSQSMLLLIPTGVFLMSCFVICQEFLNRIVIIY
jgi:hypothetical protein